MGRLRGAILLIALLALAIPAGAEELARWDDPVGDDTGDGDYTYPLNEAFGEGGEADLLSFAIEKENGSLIFEFKIRNLVDPWNVGNRLTMVAVAIDTEEGGDVELRRNANAGLAEPSEYQVFAAGEVVEVIDSSAEPVDIGASIETDIKNGTIRIRVPIDAIDGAAPDWRFTPAVGLQDDYGAGGLGDFREVKKVAEEWSGGGGGDLSIDTNVYDIVVPVPRKILGLFGGGKRSQEEILGNCSLETGQLVVLPALALE
ncbi:MAG: glucodextranase DOMON-like domain-containing protein [Candidatus Eisenbacteria bacterium]